jgi:WXG100 family type VII secretion target
MAEAAQRVGDSFDVIVGIKGQLQDYAVTAAGKWKGESSRSFQNVMGEFDKQFMTICDSLNDLREKLGAARMSYEATEQQQLEATNKIDALLNNRT